MEYRYIEFKDRLNYRMETNGKLWFVGEPSEELISELELEEHKKYHDGSGKTYFTSLTKVGEKGWELQFVSPCGIYLEKGPNVAGPIENLYVFRKVISND